MLTPTWRSGLFLLLLASLATGRRLGRPGGDDDEEDEQPWMSEPGEIRRHRDPKPAAQPENTGSSGYSYDDQEQTPPRAECEVDSFRRGQSECDRILRMNLPHHHGSHDYVCYSLRKYKMCVASVMIQSSCYERTFVSQELHKIRGIIQGYSVDCFNITRETNRRGLKVRRLRFRIAKVKLSLECSPATAWAVELTCTKDFESDMKALNQLNEPSTAIRKSCKTILRYYHCLTPVTESASCQKNPEFIKHLEYFPQAITSRYRELCLRELEISPSLFKEKGNRASMAAVVGKADNCKEEEASREFLACALVFNEVVSHTTDRFRQCEAYNNFIQCTNAIARTLNCGDSSEFHHHAIHVLSVLLHDYQNNCRMPKRGRAGADKADSAGTNTSGASNSSVPHNEVGPRLSENVPDARPVEPTSQPPQHERGPTRRKYFKNTDEVFKITTENPFYPPLRKMPLEPRIPQAEDYPRSHDDDSSQLERKRPEPRRDNDLRPGRESRRGKYGRKGSAHHGGARRGGSYDERNSDIEEDSVRKGGFKGPRGEGRRNRLGNWGSKRDDQERDDGYPADPNEGFLEDTDELEGMNRRKRRLHE